MTFGDIKKADAEEREFQKELADVLGVSVRFVSQAVNGYHDKHFAYNIYKIKK